MAKSIFYHIPKRQIVEVEKEVEKANISSRNKSTKFPFNLEAFYPDASWGIVNHFVQTIVFVEVFFFFFLDFMDCYLLQKPYEWFLLTVYMWFWIY